MSDTSPSESPYEPSTGAQPGAKSPSPEVNLTPADVKGLKEVVYVLSTVMVVAVVGLIIQFILNSAVAAHNLDVQVAELKGQIQGLIQINSVARSEAKDIEALTKKVSDLQWMISQQGK